MKNSHLLLFFIIIVSILDWLTKISELEYWGLIIVLAITSVLFQLEDMEEKL